VQAPCLQQVTKLALCAMCMQQLQTVSLLSCTVVYTAARSITGRCGTGQSGGETAGWDIWAICTQQTNRLSATIWLMHVWLMLLLLLLLLPLCRGAAATH
jgi:hypothetical protein